MPKSKAKTTRPVISRRGLCAEKSRLASYKISCGVYTERSERARNDKSRETEIALAICADDAARIAKNIAALRALGAYRLEPQPTQNIRDIHFDTRDHALQKQKLALRIRERDSETLITLKGPSQKTASGAQERMEIEARWSPVALTRVLRELNTRGIVVKISPRDFARAEPHATLARLGFRAIQKRTTRRQIRHVVPRDAPRKTVDAELAIDAVTFRFGRQRVHLREIEIEAKHAQARLGDLARQFETMFAPALRVWYGKLTTGRAIQVLLEQGVLQELLDDENNLTPRAYDRIERELGGGGWDTQLG
ncbi:MAG: CYTH domain-containing protein [Chloroflexi bacterium]|nr:CYTH domain-containing protein [Chloroflexota bacterium]